MNTASSHEVGEEPHCSTYRVPDSHGDEHEHGGGVHKYIQGNRLPFAAIPPTIPSRLNYACATTVHTQEFI